jgi:hypothetical protein
MKVTRKETELPLEGKEDKQKKLQMEMLKILRWVFIIIIWGQHSQSRSCADGGID